MGRVLNIEELRNEIQVDWGWTNEEIIDYLNEGYLKMIEIADRALYKTEKEWNERTEPL